MEKSKAEDKQKQEDETIENIAQALIQIAKDIVKKKKKPTETYKSTTSSK